MFISNIIKFKLYTPETAGGNMGFTYYIPATTCANTVNLIEFILYL